jgi:hypothetical protein
MLVGKRNDMLTKCRLCSLAGSCVLVLQRNDSGVQVIHALDGGGVLGCLCRHARREPGHLRERQ